MSLLRIVSNTANLLCMILPVIRTLQMVSMIITLLVQSSMGLNFPCLSSCNRFVNFHCFLFTSLFLYQVQVIKQGYLFKRPQNTRGEWKRRFFVLDSHGTLYYYGNKGKPVCDLNWPLNAA